jgi:ABC-type Mn2+/Zn2+ transport system permease subunit
LGGESCRSFTRGPCSHSPALGAYIGRNLTGGTGIALFIVAFGCVFGLNIASSRGRDQVAIGLLFGLGLLLGLAVGPVLAV